MARIRTIHPDIAQSRSMRRVNRDARLLFTLLLTVADDEGRARARIGLLAAQLFPDDADAPIMLPAWLDELEREACIKRYTVEDDAFLVIVNWHTWQSICHPTASKLPAPPDFEKLSGKSTKSAGKPPECNKEVPNSRISLEEIFGTDAAADLTPKDVNRALKAIVVHSAAAGSYPSMLRSLHLIGKTLGMWSGGAPSAGAAPADTGQNDLEEALAAQKPVEEVSGK